MQYRRRRVYSASRQHHRLEAGRYRTSRKFSARRPADLLDPNSSRLPRSQKQTGNWDED